MCEALPPARQLVLAKQRNSAPHTKLASPQKPQSYWPRHTRLRLKCQHRLKQNWEKLLHFLFKNKRYSTTLGTAHTSGC